ncbi:hypothetical protein DDZ13_13655 [Coraliomargarita sinensis]|uniref:Uncharacterized protein n=1 Tax=Coraliomargarita sinensis TaxID=2174842 RepID=A0A317ZGN7_9BACT|nr:hypothetical protein DDZ13_13655 [Coraliomargarita sinensis]
MHNRRKKDTCVELELEIVRILIWQMVLPLPSIGVKERNTGPQNIVRMILAQRPGFGPGRFTAYPATTAQDMP